MEARFGDDALGATELQHDRLMCLVNRKQRARRNNAETDRQDAEDQEGSAIHDLRLPSYWTAAPAGHPSMTGAGGFTS